MVNLPSWRVDCFGGRASTSSCRERQTGEYVAARLAAEARALNDLKRDEGVKYVHAANPIGN